jgi:hypothetical protein
METAFLFNRIKDAAGQAAWNAYDKQLRLRSEKTFVRSPDAERTILRDWTASYLYAKNVLRDRWPEFEWAIEAAEPATDPAAVRAVYNYARYVFDDRFEPCEKHVASDATTAVDYAKDVLNRTWNDLDANFSTAIMAIERHPTAHAAYLKEVRSATPAVKNAKF